MTWPWLYNSSNAGWINDETLSNGIIRPKALSLLTYWQGKAMIRLGSDKLVSLTILGCPDLLNYWIFIIERTLIHTEQFILGCSVEWLPWRTCVQLHSLPIHSSWQCSKRSNYSQCPLLRLERPGIIYIALHGIINRYFYQTRVWSLAMLFTHWLTHWLTHSLTPV